MDQNSIDRTVKHIKDVPRIEARFAQLTLEEIDQLVDVHQTIMSVRLAQCRRSFQMLFMVMSKGHKMPVGSFDILLGSEQIGDATIDTYARVERDKSKNTFSVRPFTRNGRIEDHEFTTETFGDTFRYKYGTYFSKSATLEVDHDDPDSTIRLTRVEGQLVTEMTTKEKALFLSALDNLVAPHIEDTENTLILLHQAALDTTLNPDIAERFRIHY